MRLRLNYLGLVTLVLMGFSGNAQFVPKADDLPYYEKYYAPIAGFYTHVDFGLSTGVGKWGAAPTPDDGFLDGFLGEGGMGAGTGFHLKFGQMVPLTFRDDYADTWYSGIHWGLEISEHGAPSWDDVGGDALFYYSEDESEDGFSLGRATTLSAQLGFYESYNMGNRFVIETGIDVNFPLFASDFPYTNQVYLGGLNGNITVFPAEADNGDALAWQPGFSLHVALRARNLRYYIEYYHQGVNHYYEMAQRDVNNNEVSVEGFNADYTISTIRVGIGYLFLQD